MRNATFTAPPTLMARPQLPQGHSALASDNLVLASGLEIKYLEHYRKPLGSDT